MIDYILILLALVFFGLMLYFWFITLYRIVKSEELDSIQKVGWLTVCILSNLAGVVLYTFFRNVIHNMARSMAYDKKLDMEHD
ncbi:PLDc N-terminal domain-containing protein [Rubellicoccus peritrichatus]|uniref:PLDc N-terminal domain-containing protein n=1 Tax=Rubellicoccus peritrichatus TaxID=3080537 RepID=UPI003CE53974